VNFTRTVTVTSAKFTLYSPTRFLLPAQIRLIYKLFKDGILLLRGISNVVAQLRCHDQNRSLVRILLRVENDLSTVAVPTGSRSKRLIAAENVGYIFSYWGEVAKVSSMSGVERSPSKRAHLAGGPWHSESLG
jgi:hypothetical protein